MLQTKEHGKPPKKYYELLKPGEIIDIKYYQQQLTNLNCFMLQKSQNTKRGNTKSFFFMTILHHI
jgi:Transposase.